MSTEGKWNLKSRVLTRVAHQFTLVPMSSHITKGFGASKTREAKFRLPSALDEELQTIAKRKYVTKSHVVRLACIDLVAREKKKAA